jgi:hypothetical protein
MNHNVCLYYHATVDRTRTWFVVGIFRNEDHVAFERTLEEDHTVVEFFVPPQQETEFLAILGRLQRLGYVFDYKKLPNRMAG